MKLEMINPTKWVETVVFTDPTNHGELTTMTYVMGKAQEPNIFAVIRSEEGDVFDEIVTEERANAGRIDAMDASDTE